MIDPRSILMGHREVLFVSHINIMHTVYKQHERSTSRWHHCTEKVWQTKSLILFEVTPESGRLCPYIFIDRGEDRAWWSWSPALRRHNPPVSILHWGEQTNCAHNVCSRILVWFPLLTDVGSHRLLACPSMYEATLFPLVCQTIKLDRGGGGCVELPLFRHPGSPDQLTALRKVTPIALVD